MWVACHPGSHGHDTHHHCVGLAARVTTATQLIQTGRPWPRCPPPWHSRPLACVLWRASEYVLVEDGTLVSLKGPHSPWVLKHRCSEDSPPVRAHGSSFRHQGDAAHWGTVWNVCTPSRLSQRVEGATKMPCSAQDSPTVTRAPASMAVVSRPRSPALALSKWTPTFWGGRGGGLLSTMQPEKLKR